LGAWPGSCARLANDRVVPASARGGADVVGYVELDTDLAEGGTRSRYAGLAGVTVRGWG
jgi:hypothetical protein